MTNKFIILENEDARVVAININEIESVGLIDTMTQTDYADYKVLITLKSGRRRIIGFNPMDYELARNDVKELVRRINENDFNSHDVYLGEVEPES